MGGLWLFEGIERTLTSFGLLIMMMIIVIALKNSSGQEAQWGDKSHNK